MKTKIQNKVIKELSTMINRWVKDCNLFAGGCCFAAYGLAWYLSKLGIKYNVILFQYDEILNATKFSEAINGSGVCHAAIEVVYKHRKFLIGDCDRIYQFFKNTGYDYNIRRYENITPESILDGYLNNDWNPMWDTNYNTYLLDSIKQIAEKYYSEI